MPYIGSYFAKATGKDIFTGTGLTATFTLSRQPGGSNGVVVFVGGSVQTTNYAVTGNSLVFADNVPSGVEVVVVYIAVEQTVAGGVAKTGSSNSWTATQVPPATALTDGAAISWNCLIGQVATVTLGGSRTVSAPTNVVQNASYILVVTQDATGSRLLSWNSAFKFAGAVKPSLTTTASAVDVITFIGGAGNTMLCVGVANDVK